MARQKEGSEEMFVGAAMRVWAAKLKQKKPLLAAQSIQVKLATRLGDGRSIGLSGVSILGLPQFGAIALPLPLFLQNSQFFFQKIHSDRFYIHLSSDIEELTTFRNSGLSSPEVLTFISDSIPGPYVAKYHLILGETHTYEYGGNIVINPNGKIVIEMVRGSQELVTSGKITPNYIAERDQFTHVLHYSFEDNTLRKAVYNALLSIPHDGKTFIPGYYEFILFRRDKSSFFEPIFFDYRDDPIYML